MAQALQPEKLSAGFTLNAFLSINRNDAEAAFKVFTRTVGETRGYAVNTKVQVFENRPDLDAAIGAGKLQLIVLDSWSYLELTNRSSLTPILVPSDQTQLAKRFFILTHRTSTLSNVLSLRNKTFNMLAAPNANLGSRWLQTTLTEAGLGSPENAFTSIEQHSKPTSVVLPVFFRKRDACLVDATGYALMSELNPQVSRDLQVIASSDLLVNALVCLHNSHWPNRPFQQAVTDALNQLDQTPPGQQILALFKISRLLPFQDALLDSVRILREKSRSLGLVPIDMP